MQNPFSISFGTTPTQYISRITQTNQILDTFKAEVPSNHVYMLTGVRGCGKTVMMTDIAEKLRKEKDWIAVELSPERDMLQSLAENLYAIPQLRALFIKARLDFSALGFSDSEIDDIIVNKAKVWLDRGTMFGPEGEYYQRINVATPRPVLEDALNRIAKAFKEAQHV